MDRVKTESEMSIDWNRIESFVGYGKRDAQVVFIGLEEGLSRSSKLEKDLVRRSTFKAIEDIKAAHQGLEGADRLWDERKPKIQRTWRPMCQLMLAYDDWLPRNIDRAARARYQADKLGRSQGNSLLMELLPYPHVLTSIQGIGLTKDLVDSKVVRNTRACFFASG